MIKKEQSSESPQAEIYTGKSWVAGPHLNSWREIGEREAPASILFYNDLLLSFIGTAC